MLWRNRAIGELEWQRGWFDQELRDGARGWVTGVAPPSLPDVGRSWRVAPEAPSAPLSTPLYSPEARGWAPFLSWRCCETPLVTTAISAFLPTRPRVSRILIIPASLLTEASGKAGRFSEPAAGSELVAPEGLEESKGSLQAAKC